MAVTVTVSWTYSGACDGFRVYRKLAGGVYSLEATKANTVFAHIDSAPAYG